MVIWYVVMAVALAGMIWCAKNQKRVKNAQLLAVLCLIVSVIAVGGALKEFFGVGDIARSISNSNQFELSKIDQIVKYLEANYAGKKVVILTRSDLDQVENGINHVQEFKERCKGLTVLDTVTMDIPKEVPNPSPDAPPMMLDQIMNAKFFNTYFNKCKDLKPDLIINFAGLPMFPEEAAKLVIWEWKNTPKLVFFDVNELAMAATPNDFIKGIIAVSIATKTNVEFNFLEDKAPEDLKQAFDLRFVIVDGKNVKNLVADGTLMFPNAQKK